MPVTQKFGNSKTTPKVAGLGHEGKYTLSSHTANLGHHFNNPAQNTDMLSILNRNTIPKQTSNLDNELLHQRLSSQTDISNPNNNINSASNMYGSYVDLDIFKRVRAKSDSSYNSQNHMSSYATSPFDRNYSFNQNHNQTALDLQKLSPLRNSFNSPQSTHPNLGSSYKLSPSSSNVRLGGGRSPSPMNSPKLGTSDNSPISEKSPTLFRRSESPIYSNTNSNFPFFKQDSVIRNKQSNVPTDLQNLYQK